MCAGLWRTPGQRRFHGLNVIFLESLGLLRSAQVQPRDPMVREIITEILLISLTVAKTVNIQNTQTWGPSNLGLCPHTQTNTHALTD